MSAHPHLGNSLACFVFSDHVDGWSLARLMALSTCALTRLRASQRGNS